MRDAWLLLGALCVATAMISGAGARQAPKSKPEDWVETPPKASGAQEAQRVVVSADTDAWHLKETILSEQDTYIKYEEKVRSGEDTSSPEPAASPSREPEAATNKSTANATKVAPSSETAAPDAKETTPYEDDPRHLERQHMEDFVAITEKIYVVKRNFNLDRVERCESAQRLRQLSDTQYEYLLRTRHYQSPALMSMKVFFKISKTGVHKDYNAVTYTHGPVPMVFTKSYAGNKLDKALDEPSIERKLMYISPDKTCAILVEDLKRRRKGCQLVQPESAIENGIPLECNKVYEARCGRKSLILYEPICKTLPDSVPHEEL